MPGYSETAVEAVTVGRASSVPGPSTGAAVVPAGPAAAAGCCMATAVTAVTVPTAARARSEAPGGAGGAGGKGSILFGQAGARGANGDLGASIGAGGDGDYSPYIDLSVYTGADGYDFASASQAGVQNVTLAFIDADANGQPAWDGYTSQEINGGSQISYINNQIANMHAAGINGTLSFGGDPASLPKGSTDLSAVPGQTPAALEQQYASIVNTYHIYNLDFDVEGSLVGNTQAVTTQAQAIAMLQAQEAAAGTPVTVSYTLAVDPTGLESGEVNVLQIANANGVSRLPREHHGHELRPARRRHGRVRDRRLDGNPQSVDDAVSGSVQPTGVADARGDDLARNQRRPLSHQPDFHPG